MKITYTDIWKVVVGTLIGNGLGIAMATYHANGWVDYRVMMDIHFGMVLVGIALTCYMKWFKKGE